MHESSHQYVPTYVNRRKFVVLLGLPFYSGVLDKGFTTCNQFNIHLDKTNKKEAYQKNLCDHEMIIMLHPYRLNNLIIGSVKLACATYLVIISMNFLDDFSVIVPKHHRLKKHQKTTKKKNIMLFPLILNCRFITDILRENLCKVN